MPANKRQHFVPKHLLENFAPDAEKKQINLIHIASSKIVRSASLKEQCYRDYYYGKDLEFEHALTSIEGVQAKVIGDIVSSKSINPFKTAEVALLFALQRARTTSTEAEMNGIVDSMMKLAMHGRFDEKTLRGVRIALKNGPNFNIQTAFKMRGMLYDLRQYVVVNSSSTPFVLSDNPVVTTNWFCRSRYPNRSGIGTGTSGLQMIVPLTPTTAILLLDPGVYSMDAPSGRVRMTRSSDVQLLNRLQWVNAKHNVYFPSGLHDGAMSDLIATPRPEAVKHAFERMEKLDGVQHFVHTEKDEYAAPSEGVTSELVRFGAKPLPFDIKIPGMHIRPKPSFHDDGSLASPMRDPIWAQIVRDFSDAVDAGRASASNVPDFVERHALEPMIGPWRQRMAMRTVASLKWKAGPHKR